MSRAIRLKEMIQIQNEQDYRTERDGSDSEGRQYEYPSSARCVGNVDKFNEW